ncbi:alpha/beta hydrolase [Micromonospora sp. CPCC 206060]|uniref:alpha/beta hydrolase n=1 Tax=Micromonospora sp. CPCC 206060 TaxID=3122406 RepID=UPI002FEEF9E9
MLETEDFVFTVHEQRLAATKIYPPDRSEPTVLHLHGLGNTASRHTIRYLLEPLAMDGHGSMTFEFSGNGDSTGVMEESSLRRRRDETLAAVAQLGTDEPPVIIGTSMGAHLAAWTAPEVRPRALILFCPAAYPEHADDLRFDGSLSRPGNYSHSPAYAGLRNFTGDLLIIAAENDTVAPRQITEGYLEHARHARSTKVLWLDCYDHFVHRRLPDDEELRTTVLAAILHVVNSKPESR